MMRIASEPISKVFVAPIFSRSFCISFLCYILILIIPALILINISCNSSVHYRLLARVQANSTGSCLHLSRLSTIVSK